MKIKQIKKRDGSIVSFDSSRIEKAILGACNELEYEMEPTQLSVIVDTVVGVLESRFPMMIPSVEDVQDVVEMSLADKGLFTVAKAYIIYRYERAKERSVGQLVGATA